MKKSFLTLCSLLIISLSANESNEDPFRYASAVKTFSEGLLPIKMGPRWATDDNQTKLSEVNKWGFIDRSGEFVIRPKFDLVGEKGFSNNLAYVQIKGLSNSPVDIKWGMIDRTGKYILEPVYYEIRPLPNGNAIAIKSIKVNNSSYVMAPNILISKEGKIIKTPDCSIIQYLGESLYSCRMNDLEALMSGEGKLLTKPAFTQINNFQNGYATVVNNDVVNGKKMGLIDQNGTIRIEPKYDSIRPYEFAPLSVSLNKQYGYVSKDGEVIVAPTYKNANIFHDGLAPVEINGTWEYINTKGEQVTHEKFINANGLSNGVGLVSKKNFLGLTRFGYIDSNGKYIAEPIYSMAFNFTEGLAGVCRSTIIGDKLCGFINTNGEEITSFAYTYVSPFQSGIAKVGERSMSGSNMVTFGYINKNGEKFFQSEKAINIKSSLAFTDIFIGAFDQNGYAKLQQKGQWGIINRQGEIVIPPQYQNIDIFQDGIIKAYKVGGGIVFLDEKNNIILPRQ